MESYYWTTEEYHSDNNITMSEYLEMQEEFTHEQHLTIDYADGTYAEGLDCKGNRWSVHASGDGDSFNHKIEFYLLKKALDKI
tara:strand:- start:83 stop:331 length:249 start_codon:yes stop_codon:yes gene_type:complete